MRSEQEMMSMLIGFAENDSRIRLVTLEGSRTNKHIPRDPFQDFDISYFVTDMNSFKENDDWLARQFDDCCNEFWNVSTYVVKGLARNEILFAIDHLNGIARPNLLRMMTWQIGSERGYTFSVGKNYKFINHYLPKKDWEALLSTFAQHGCQEMWQSLFTCYELFRKYAKTVAGNLEYAYPDYDEAVTRYTASIYSSLSNYVNESSSCYELPPTVSVEAREVPSLRLQS